jgi:hypothetical protein
MTKRLVFWVVFLFLVPAAVLITEEPFSRSFETESQSFAIDQRERSPEINHVSGFLKRLPRTKSLPKSLPTLNPARQEISVLGRANDRWVSPPSKSSVYQQISVYRL